VDAELDQLIVRLRTRRSAEDALIRLVEIGEPALRRLLQVAKDMSHPYWNPKGSLRDQDDELAFAVARVGEKNVQALPEILRKDPALLDDATVVWAIGQMKAPVENVLLRALRSRNEFARWAAATWLAEHGTERAVQPLIAHLEEERDAMAYDASIVTLGEIGDERAVRPLRRQLWTLAAFLDRPLRRDLKEAIRKVKRREPTP
jgi:HEAT repeat protein